VITVIGRWSALSVNFLLRGFWFDENVITISYKLNICFVYRCEK